MLPIPFFVPQSHYAIIPAPNQLFGTDGLTMCFGFIGILNNNNLFCGHLDNSIAATGPNLAQISSRTQHLLTQALTGHTVNQLHVATANLNKSEVQAINSGISAFCQALQPQIIPTPYQGNGIAYNQGNVSAGGNFQTPATNLLTTPVAGFTI